MKCDRAVLTTSASAFPRGTARSFSFFFSYPASEADPVHPASFISCYKQDGQDPLRLQDRSNFFKRVFDILFSFLILMACLPLFCILALGIKCSSQGPIFYKSIRVGQNGSRFRCWKLRTMYVDAEEKLKELLKEPRYAAEWNKYYKLKQDPRVTPFGKLLRKASLDELPQFWNVLRGDLSVVGPRPYLAREIDHRFEKILSVRPGITGLWQTSGRSLLTFEERIRCDEKYVRERSFAFDLFLICKTIPTILFPKGAC